MSRNKRPHLHTLNMHDATYELAVDGKQRAEELVAQWRKVLKEQNNPAYKQMDEMSFPLDWIVRRALYDLVYEKLEDDLHPHIWEGRATQEEYEIIKSLRKDYWP